MFDETLNGTPAKKLVADIANQCRVKRRIDQPGIEASGGYVDILLARVTLTEIYETLKRMEGSQEQLSDWGKAMLARGEVTMKIRETLAAIQEPLAIVSDFTDGELRIGVRKKNSL